MRVFVAGGTGAVGRQMIPRLVAAGHSVVAITRQPAKCDWLRRAGAAAMICDVFDVDRLNAAVREAAPEALVHQLTDLPATMNPRKLSDIYTRNNRVRRDGTRNLIAAARLANVNRFIVQSMGTWYRPEGGPIKTETDPLWRDAPEPIGTAVRTVVDMEAAVLGGVPIGVVLRYGAFYGWGTWYAADGEIAQRVRSRGLPIVGSGSGITSFIHVEDAAAAALSALEARSSAIYNVVDDDPAPGSEWLPAYARALRAPPPRRVPELVARLFLGKALTAWITTMRGASNGAAASALGWRPRYASWRDGFGIT
jgi:nucleoside-diphosphate-sugar epimerase